MRFITGWVSELVATICIALVMLSGCHAVKEPVSKMDMADMRTAGQLLRGFYQLENDRWRWTGQKFSVALKPPDGAEQRGATLGLHIYLPESQIESLGPMTLSACTGEFSLASETFSKGGTYIYSREIPKDALATSLLPVDFQFDKATAPFTGDGRQLAAIVTNVELQTD